MCGEPSALLHLRRGPEEGSLPPSEGKTYDGRLCCTVLDDPYDAYEWSFVAVPASGKRE